MVQIYARPGSPEHVIRRDSADQLMPWRERWSPVFDDDLTRHFNESIQITFISACFAFMIVYSRTFLPDEDAAVETASTSPVRELGTLLLIPAVRESCVIELVSHIINSLFVTFIIVLAVSVVGLSDVEAATLITIQGVTAVLALFVLGPLVRSVRS